MTSDSQSFRSASQPVSYSVNALASDDSTDILDLLRLRASLREQVIRSRKTLGKLCHELERVEAGIQRFTGTFQKTPHERSQNFGAFTLLVFKALEQANRPLNAREITLKILTDQGFGEMGHDLRTRTMQRVNICLWTQTQKGRLRKSEPETRPIRWEFVRLAPDMTAAEPLPWHSEL